MELLKSSVSEKLGKGYFLIQGHMLKTYLAYAENLKVNLINPAGVIFSGFSGLIVPPL